MKKKVVVRPAADLDLEQHYLYLARQNYQVAERFRAAVLTAKKHIVAHPTGGTRLDYPARPDLALRFIRPKGFAKYLVIYQITDDCVFIIRILHGSQNLDAEVRP
ncbi:MAG TPA: type II toxin-antitoxin system RelE/ParE family toxin [Pirellulaceae bacterium]